jgi:hypothetical protein
MVIEIISTLITYSPLNSFALASLECLPKLVFQINIDIFSSILILLNLIFEHNHHIYYDKNPIKVSNHIYQSVYWDSLFSPFSVDLPQIIEYKIDKLTINIPIISRNKQTIILSKKDISLVANALLSASANCPDLFMLFI